MLLVREEAGRQSIVRAIQFVQRFIERLDDSDGEKRKKQFAIEQWIHKRKLNDRRLHEVPTIERPASHAPAPEENGACALGFGDNALKSRERGPIDDRSLGTRRVAWDRQ